MVDPAATLVAGFHEQAHGGGQSRSGSGTMQVLAVLLAAAVVHTVPTLPGSWPRTRGAGEREQTP
jgi:hypothetical protein